MDTQFLSDIVNVNGTLYAVGFASIAVKQVVMNRNVSFSKN